MQEAISVHIGQAGCQSGSTCWELFCLEHGVQSDGSVPSEMKSESRPTGPGKAMHSFFSETQAGKLVPRATFIDLEPTVVDCIRKGKHRALFDPQQLLSGKEDAASNFSRGHYTIGKEQIDVTMDRIRLQAEECDNLQGFFVYHALGGGTGSGLGALLMERLSVDYGKKCKFNFTVFPSHGIASTVVEPYNAVLAMPSLIEHSDLTMMLTNEALYDQCSGPLRVEAPSYRNINQLVAQTASSLTCSMRFDGSALNVSMQDMLTNLVPYPRIHHIVPSYAPLIPAESKSLEQPSVLEMTNFCLDPAGYLAKCGQERNRYMAICLMYRGDVTTKDVHAAIASLRVAQDVKFMPEGWIPTGYKCGVNLQSPVFFPDGDLAKLPRSLCALSNMTGCTDVFERIAHKFDLMYAKRAFVHWFMGEGGSGDSVSEAREDLAALCKDYEWSDVAWLEEGEGDADGEEA